MKTTKNIIRQTELVLIEWMDKNGISLLRFSMGVVFFWFGVLKFFSGLSPAQDLAQRTIELLTFGLVTGQVSIILLALWEVIIGLGFLTGKYIKFTLYLLFAQMAGTFTPVFLFSEEVFTAIPYAPTIEGQYIIKNIVLVCAGFVIGGSALREEKHNKIEKGKCCKAA